LFTGLYLGAIGGEGGDLNEVQAAYLATCQYLPNLPGFRQLRQGRKGRLQNCRFAAVARIFGGIHDVKVRYLAHIFYIG